MTTETAQPATNVQQWHELATQLRIDSIRASTAAGSGHPTSSLSAADLMAVLLAKYLHYDFNNPKNPDNDHLIFSKGHASPLVYSIFKAAGAISDEQLLSFRKFGSIFEGHPTPEIPWVDVATGSLGQGFPIGIGVGLAGKYLDKLPYHIWVLLGDSETAEGSVWEGFDHGSHYNLDNVTAIIDINRLGQTGQTELGWDIDAYKRRVEAFGWHGIPIDGHNLEEIDRAYQEALDHKGQPSVILAKTIKGKGVEEVANKLNWHGKAFGSNLEQAALKELGPETNMVVQVHKPEGGQPASTGQAQSFQAPNYGPNDQVATRKGYGDGLKALGASNPKVVALDAEVSNSTYSEEFKNAYPDRYFEMYIAEQQLVASAVGLQVRGYIPFASTFAAFLSRAYDFVRMAAVSRANINLSGSHAGVSIGEDGPSQMALEDLAMFRAVHDSVVLYPSDAGQTVKLVQEMSNRHGINYIRTTREKTPILYGQDEQFPIGGSKVVRQSDGDKVTVIAAGITLHETLKAYEQLKGEGIAIRVIDLYSVKPIDTDTIRAAAKATNNRIITVEDHWAEGGIGDAVLDVFVGQDEELPVVVKLAVTKMPTSGKPEELMHAQGIDADCIANAVRQLAGKSS